MPFEISTENLEAISAIERACSVLSLVGCIFTIITFCAFKSFHKPVNRLVFYATFGNMLSNVGTLMSKAYTDHPESPMCQFQGFIIQMFMPADAFWTLAMAVNVYLTFYHKFDAARLRKIEIPYILCCYGIPLLPALIYIWVTDRKGNPVYGNATLWCWVADGWEVLRIATFYGPVWLSIGITVFIYLRAGRTIYEKRRELYYLSSTEADTLDSACGMSKVTEFSVTSEAVQRTFSSLEIHPAGRVGPVVSPVSGQYSVTISANPWQAYVGSGPPVPPRSKKSLQQRSAAQRRRVYERNNAAWSYTKCSILFFTAMLITWLPSSANRVYSVIHETKHSLALEFMSAFVLPLQGFWNAVVYCVTSWGACKSLWADMRSGRWVDFKHWTINRCRPQGNCHDSRFSVGQHKMHSRFDCERLESSESVRETRVVGERARPGNSGDA